MKFLAIADDAGFNLSVDHASTAAVKNSLVSTLSLMPCGASFAHTAAQLRAAGIKKISYHLTLGEPLQQALSGKESSLVDSHGYFLDRTESTYILENCSEKTLSWLYSEIDAQLSRLLNYGFEVIHLCGHRHFHILPAVRETLLKVWHNHQLSPPLVRGYDSTLPALKHSNACSLLLKHALPAVNFFLASGWGLSNTIGFAWSKNPNWQVLQEEIEQAFISANFPLSTAGLELMLHFAEYEKQDARLSLCRDLQYRQYQGIHRSNLMSSFELEMQYFNP